MFVACLSFAFNFPCEVVAQDSFSLLFEKALHESRDGNFVDALHSWDDCLKLSPDNPIALSNRGNVRLALGDAEGAIIDQTDAIQLLPFEIDPHLNRGMAEEALQHWNAAKKDYKWVLKREPQNSLALYNLANALGAEGNWLQAKLLFNQAFLSDSSFAIARSSEALACYQLHQFEEAEKQLRTIIRKYPLFADARAALSVILWKKGEIGEAESHWAAASGLDSRYRQHDWLSNIRRWPPEASHDLMAFLELKPL